MAGSRTLHSALHLRLRTEASKARRGCSLWRVANSCSGVDGWAMALGHAPAARKFVVLVRTSRLRIRRSGQSLASSAFCWLAAVAFPDCAGCHSGAQEKGHTKIADNSLLLV